MRNKNFSVSFCIKLTMLGALILGAGDLISAQKVPAENAALIKYEKSIERGEYALIERDLLNYAIKNPSNAKAFEVLGKLRFAQNRLNEAKSLFQKALSLDSRSVSAKINLAQLNFQTGNAESAVSVLNEIAESDLTNDAQRLKLAQTYAVLGDCQKAQTHVEKLGAKIKNADALPVRARCLLQSGESQKAIALIPAAKITAKQNPLTALKFAEVFSDFKFYKESADVLRVVVSAAPTNADALVLLAKAEIYAKDYQNAQLHLNQAAKINPNAAEFLSTRSLLEGEQGNAAQSLETLEKSLAANPNSAAILSQYVVTAMRANQAGKGLRAAEKLLALKPNEPEYLYLHGASALQNNNLPAAEMSLNRYAEMRPNDSRGCLALGLTFAAQPEKLESARTQLGRCTTINPKNYEAKYQLGLSYKTQGETEKAIEFLEATVKDSPDYAMALRDLGAVYLQSGAENKAKIVLEKAVAIDASDADTHFQLSRLYNLIGATELAKKHLELFQKLKNSTKSGM